jgi:hypothetical protein
MLRDMISRRKKPVVTNIVSWKVNPESCPNWHSWNLLRLSSVTICAKRPQKANEMKLLKRDRKSVV